MIFTIVTVLFLPMSFIANFFAIDMQGWQSEKTVGWVSMYTFGIGLGISVPLIVTAFMVPDLVVAVGAVISPRRLFQEWKARRRPPREDGDSDEMDAVAAEKVDRFSPSPSSAKGWDLDGLAPRQLRLSFEPGREHGGVLSRLSPLPRGSSGRKVSIGSAWAARPSQERDLERGRGHLPGGGPSREH